MAKPGTHPSRALKRTNAPIAFKIEAGINNESVHEYSSFDGRVSFDKIMASAFASRETKSKIEIKRLLKAVHTLSQRTGGICAPCAVFLRVVISNGLELS